MRAAQHYRCKHSVEAALWHDTDESREAFADWFAGHDALFETRGPVVVLPGDGGEVQEGEWILYSHGEFIVLGDEEFAETYEADEADAASAARTEGSP